MLARDWSGTGYLVGIHVRGNLKERGSTTMKKVFAAVGAMLFAAIASFSQEKPGTLAALEFQTPKNGMVKQYEDGRKQKAEWHKQQKDSQPLMVWEIMSGDHTG